MSTSDRHVPMDHASPGFAQCWSAAGRHLQAQAEGTLFWLRSHLNPPFLEHLSFRIGNQVFFIRVEDVDGVVQGPGSTEGLEWIASECRGHALIMPMRFRDPEWRPDAAGWGLMELKTQRLFNPLDVVTDTPEEMTPWELHDLAVQVVRRDLEKSGKKLMSWQSAPKVSPSIWFEGEAGPEWVVVFGAHRSSPIPELPATVRVVDNEVLKLSTTGHLAYVEYAAADDPFDPVTNGDVEPLPMYRGSKLFAKYDGLTPLLVPDDLEIESVSRQLVNELVGWFENLLESDTVLPKAFTGVSRSGMQFIVVMSRLGLDQNQHYAFMRYVLHREGCYAFGVKITVAQEVKNIPGVAAEEIHCFYSGQHDSYWTVEVGSKHPDNWSEGIRVIRATETRQPELFFLDLLKTPYEASEHDEQFSELWEQTRNSVQWRKR